MLIQIVFNKSGTSDRNLAPSSCSRQQLLEMKSGGFTIDVPHTLSEGKIGKQQTIQTKQDIFSPAVGFLLVEASCQVAGNICGISGCCWCP